MRVGNMLAAVLFPFLCVAVSTALSQSLLFNVGGPALPDISFVQDPTSNLLSSASAAVNVSANAVSLASSWAPIYSSYRFAFGGNLSYRFNVPNGNYSVSLAFAETYEKAFFAGARQFDVVVNGRVYFERLDVFATVGAGQALYLRADNVAVGSGSLTVSMRRIADRQNPFLSAMIIQPAGV